MDRKEVALETLFGIILYPSATKWHPEHDDIKRPGQGTRTNEMHLEPASKVF